MVSTEQECQDYLFSIPEFIGIPIVCKKCPFVVGSSIEEAIDKKQKKNIGKPSKEKGKGIWIEDQRVKKSSFNSEEQHVPESVENCLVFSGFVKFYMFPFGCVYMSVLLLTIVLVFC